MFHTCLKWHRENILCINISVGKCQKCGVILQLYCGNPRSIVISIIYGYALIGSIYTIKLLRNQNYTGLHVGQSLNFENRDSVNFMDS